MYKRKDVIKYDGFFKTFEYQRVPEDWIHELFNYFIHGLPPGSFHTSCFANDLLGAAVHSHISNKWEAITGMMKWVNENAPRGSWGNREAVSNWIKLPKEERQIIIEQKWQTLPDAEVTFKLLEEQ